MSTEAHKLTTKETLESFFYRRRNDLFLVLVAPGQISSSFLARVSALPFREVVGDIYGKVPFFCLFSTLMTVDDQTRRRIAVLIPLGVKLRN